MARNVNCIKLGCEAEGLDFRPCPVRVWQANRTSIVSEAWQQWIACRPMIINENRLNLCDAAHRK